ncbi:MAG: hypothetical protein AAB049_01685, partial [Nitrospirota bacterium]
MGRKTGVVTALIALTLCAFMAGVALAADPEVKTHKQPYPDRWNSIKNPPVNRNSMPDISGAE